MKVWWVTDHRRLVAELAAVDQSVAEGWFRLTRWRLHEGRLAADGVITAQGAEYPVRLVYPEQFPSVPAWVEPQDPDAHWSEHQYGKGGALCLELRPDNWHPSASGGDVLRSAYNLLRTENPLGTGATERVPSAHHVGAVQAYHIGAFPVLIGNGCLRRIREGTATGVRAFRLTFADDVWPILVFDADDETTDARPPEPNLLEGRQAIAVILARAPVVGDAPSSRRDLGQQLALDLTAESVIGPLLVLVVADDEVVPYHSPDVDSVFLRKLVEMPDEAGARSGHVIPMSSKWAAIVGVGSVGSKIAETLVRSGLGHVVLVDGDVMLPGNLERHTLDWRDVGFRKAHAVRRRLLHIRPGADVFVVAENLDWQRSASRHATLIELLARCDVIVDATGDVPTSLFLGAVAAENKQPFVSVEVLEGGIGCIIARAVPGRDGTYSEGRAGLLAFCDHRDVRPPASGTRPYQALSGEGAIVVADDAAVSIAAGHAARVAIDALQDAIDAASPAWMLVGLRKAWIFSMHGETIGLQVPPAPAPVENGEALEAAQKTEDVQRSREFALAIVEEAAREAAPPE